MERLLERLALWSGGALFGVSFHYGSWASAAAGAAAIVMIGFVNPLLAAWRVSRHG